MRYVLTHPIPRIFPQFRRPGSNQRPARSFHVASGYDLEPRRLLAVAPLSGISLTTLPSSTPVLIYVPTAISPPTRVAAVPMDRAATLTWTPPTQPMGSAVRDYIVQYSTNGSLWATFNDGQSAIPFARVTGLTNGTSYLFRVAAQTASATSPYSVSTPPSCPRTTPSAPTALACVAGDQQVTLTWAAPISNGGAAIQGYLIQYAVITNGNPSSWKAWNGPSGTGTTATLTGLNNGNIYAFRIAAVNAAGTGTFSNTSPLAQPVAAPMITSTAAHDGGVSLSWTASPLPVSSSITAYSVQYARVPALGTMPTWTEWGRTPRTTYWADVTGLTNGVGYLFRVAAVTASGSGPTLPTSTPVIPGTVAGSFNSTIVIPGSPSTATTVGGPGMTLIALAGSRLTYCTPTNYDGLPSQLMIFVGGVQVGMATFTSPFIGTSFTFTTPSGTTYRGVFSTNEAVYF